MLILIAVIIGFLIGLIRKGSLKGLKARKISLLPIGLFGAILQIFLHFYMYTGGIGFIDPYIEIINFASYILVLVMLVFNLDDFWVILMALGITANFVVIFINGGHMPVAEVVMNILPSDFAKSIIDGFNPLYTSVQENTLLGFLGVIVPIPIPFLPMIMSLYGSVAGISPGSIVTFIGLIGFIQYVMHKKGSMMIDKNMDYLEDEGIFGEDKDGFESVSTNEDQTISEEDEFYKDIATGKAIRGDVEEDLFSQEEDEFDEELKRQTEISAKEDLFETQVLPAQGDVSETQVLPAQGDVSETQVLPAQEDVFETQVLASADLEEIQKQEIGTETEEIVVIKDTSEETKIMEPVDDESTKVLSNLQEVGTYVSQKENKELDSEDIEEILNSDEAGFFTKKYYEEKLAMEKERMELEMRERELSRVAQSMLDAKASPHAVPETDLRIVESFRLTDLDQPFVLRSEKNQYERKEFAESYEGKEEFTEDDMLNVWQRLNQEDQRRKAQRRQEAIKQSNEETDVFLKPSTTEELGISLKEIEDVTEPEIKIAIHDERKEKAFNQMSEEEKTEYEETIEERKKAGYELVQLELDGKEVAFWRKKKESGEKLEESDLLEKSDLNEDDE